MSPEEMRAREEFFHQDLPKKPPLGVKPRWLHEEQRLQDLGGAIFRYLSDKMPIQIDWVEEYNEILKRMEEKK